MTKSRKIYIGILILAAGTLILDKTLLPPSASKPQDAQANMTPLERPNTAPPRNNTSEPVYAPKLPDAADPENFSKSKNFEPSPPKIQNVLSKLLNVFSGEPSPVILQHENRDLFSASDDFMSAIRLAPINLSEPNVIPEEKPERPAFPLKLTGIVIGPYRRSASINNEVFFPNQNIGPYTVISINPDSVALAYQKERLTLFLDK